MKKQNNRFKLYLNGAVDYKFAGCKLQINKVKLAFNYCGKVIPLPPPHPKCAPENRAYAWDNTFLLLPW